MTIYLVDYENVHDAGMKNSERIPEDSIIHLFYSNSEDKITLGSLAPIVSRLQLHKTRAGKQSLDMHLASYLGHEIGVHGAEHEYIIVSKDRDYDNIAMFWCEHGIHVSSQGALVTKAAEEPAPSKPEQKPSPLARQHSNRTPQKNFRTGNANSKGTASPVSTVTESPQPAAVRETAAIPSETVLDAAAAPSVEQTSEQTAAGSVEKGSGSFVSAPAGTKMETSVPEAAPSDEAKGQEPVPEVLSETAQESQPAENSSNSSEGLPVSEEPVIIENAPESAPEASVSPAGAEQTSSTPTRRQQNNRYKRGRNHSGNDYRNKTRTAEAPVQPSGNTPLPETANKYPRTPTPPSEKTLMNNRVMTKLTESKLEAAVVGKATAAVMKKYGTSNFKQAAYRELIKTFGMKDGLSYYNIVKPIF